MSNTLHLGRAVHKVLDNGALNIYPNNKMKTLFKRLTINMMMLNLLVLTVNITKLTNYIGKIVKNSKFSLLPSKYCIIRHSILDQNLDIFGPN